MGLLTRTEPSTYVGKEVMFSLANGDRVGGVVEEVSDGRVLVASPKVSLIRTETVFRAVDIVTVRVEADKK